ncbi:hypothetical protein [Rhizobium leguminosarum]|uniref:hypothetical protein n=1 Tax=Rhizobium leguminosarum TaxID=384 RepID=UPI001F364068|nr:hypothetical protein [Rhizobium leguminosarum]UIK19520.1 hypothetical protein LZK79_11100 [Rhizobium leguminosarum]
MTPIGNAIGDRFTFDELSEIMKQLHGEGTIHEATAEGKPRRIAANECIEYTRKRGLLAELFLDMAKRTDVEEKLRRQLADMLRAGFAKYKDVAPQAAAATTWLPPLSVPLQPSLLWLRTLSAEMADTVERPWVIKEMRDVANKLLAYSRNVAPLFDQKHDVGQDLEIAQVLVIEFERGAADVEVMLKRLWRPALGATETRWAVALRKASESYREAIRAADIESVRASRDVITNFLEATAFDGEVLASAQQLSFERMAVVSREVSKALGKQETVDTLVAPAFLTCDFALSYRCETYTRWKNAAELLREAAGAVPSEQDGTDDAWLATFNEKWPPVETLVRTLSLLDSNSAIAELEDQLADAINSAFEEITLNESGTSAINLVRSLGAYVDFAIARTADTRRQLEIELDKLLAFRQFVQQLKAIVAADQSSRSGQGVAQ